MISPEPRGTGTNARHEARRPARRRRAILHSILRALLTTTVLVVLYYLLPLDRPPASSAGAAVRVAVGLVVFTTVISIQVWQIAHAPYPRLRAVESIAASLPLFLLLFAITYFLLAQEQAAAFTEPLTRTDALYFTITVFSTVGFGDIAPRTEAARVIAMIQMLGDLVAIGVIARIFVSAITAGLQRRSTTTTEPDSESVDTDPSTIDR
ncbi:potassium channel family protein [Frankia sp. Cas3]|uniref:potassium channel family protein n=1 Tax=Frankia sp. Cas3 TaxID=3073926 RepID=UPI002AD20322|nr:potassium channel family protein [Frankia sp. Cas3]